MTKRSAGSLAFRHYQKIRLSVADKSLFQRSVRNKLKRTWHTLFNPHENFVSPVEAQQVDGEVNRYLEMFESRRAEWFDDEKSKPLRSPGLEVGISTPVTLEWGRQEITERDISMDELAQIEMEESRKERER